MVAWIPIAIAAANLVGSMIGSSSASKKQKKANKVLDQREKDNEAWYSRRYNEDYTQGAEAQAALNKSREYANEQFKNARGAATVAGATDESVAQSKRATNEMIGDTMSDIAAQGSVRKNAVESQYLATKDNIANQRVSVYTGQAQNTTNSSNALLQAGASALASYFGSSSN